MLDADWPRSPPGLAAAGLGAALTLAATGRLVLAHLSRYSVPAQQRYVIRILLILPVYGVVSFASLAADDEDVALYLDTLRDCYEAFVVYTFLALILEYCGGDAGCVRHLTELERPEIAHTWPLHLCLRPMRLNGRFLRWCKQGALQFVFVKPVLAASTFAMLAAGRFDDPAYQTALLVIYNLSYTLALYCLYLFYLATRGALHGHRPVRKFLAVKAVVFFTYWQSLAVAAAPLDADQAVAWNNCVLCMEMVLFSALHWAAFPPPSSSAPADGRPPRLRQLRAILSVRDVLQDARHNFMPAYQNYVLHKTEDGEAESFTTTSFVLGNVQELAWSDGVGGSDRDDVEAEVAIV